ncbi:WW domain-binding protein 11 [Neodiprion pinetum]|uniref:WW domain-binding protein 11 n=1 Tax=Neodiprion lecontei TaxID=441921 RepID=A0A6J0CEN5_NEOLC|nr:WW domain-binding protein 11 [Neodiprion lecontei]XP_046417994.1 WW domain-binding protein 11 [Neodiprion fabricii]XP_046474453.1 WW domain-binding protein 11-like [Neodiprion pinetum]XP_046612124.1 WW domain-binding protein 11 [Neodiprion virginianus]
MGRRSINTTKSGKYMNPTDQARKEARKKELKKNKKQRQLVRAAVLKGKDPAQIIEEMEKIDQMEYNVLQPPPLNEKVLKDKRKKLKETLDRVLKMYAKDDQEKWTELKEQLIQYERRRIDLVTYFEAVRHAQQVQVDEIPLPSAGGDVTRIYSGALTSQIPLPEMPQPTTHLYPAHSHFMPHHHPLINIPIPQSILKKTSAYSSAMSATPLLPLNKEPPGVPPFPPPDLSSDDEESAEKNKDSTLKSRTIRFADDKEDKKMELETREKVKEREIEKEKEKETSQVKPTTLQQKMLAMAGQDIDQFMREMEVVHKKRETERAQDLSARLTLLDADTNSKNNSNGKSDQDDNIEPPGLMDHPPPHNPHHPQHPHQHSLPPLGLPPPPLLYRPPPPPMHALRMPPPPPPRIGLRLPPGPPPGMPRLLRPGPPGMPRMPPPQMQIANMTSLANIANSQIQTQTAPGSQPKTPNVLSAAPQLINRKDKDGKGLSTIEAKPQIRNLAADITRFLPTSLRVKRDDKKKPSSLPKMPDRLPENQPQRLLQPKTKDDAYMQFMQEMEGLL